MKRTIALLVVACLLLTLVLGVTGGCAKKNLPDEKPKDMPKGAGKAKMPTAEEKAAKREAARARGLDPDKERGTPEKGIPATFDGEAGGGTDQ